MRARRRAGWGPVLVVSLSACVAPLDLLGIEEEIVEKRHDAGEADPLADDRVEDKHPIFDPGLTIEETFDPCLLRLNKSGSITKMDIAPDDGSASALYPGYPAAAAAASAQAPLLPTMEIIDTAFKPFTDGLYAAVELGAQDGSEGSYLHKRAVLDELLAELVQRSGAGTAAERPLARQAAVTLAAALGLSGSPPELPADLAAAAEGRRATFAKDPRSKPIGFYTWLPALEGIFRQDRLLQAPLEVGPAASMAVAIAARPGLAGRYGAVLGLYAGLTNPYFDRPVSDLLPLAPTAGALDDLTSLSSSLLTAHPELGGGPGCGANMALLPASDSPETKLFRGMSCRGELAGSGSLIDLLIKKIRSGAIDLTPTADSGFYDRQLYALETLLVPERAAEKDHLFLTKRYKEKLVETFKTLITQRRETHAKQLSTGVSGEDSAASGPPIEIDVYPQLPVEPFPTFYLRTARAYAFVDGVLRASVGEAFLAKAGRVLEDGSRSDVPLSTELRQRTCVLYGLSVISAASVGMRPLLTADEAAQHDPDTCAKAAREWVAGLGSDADLARDPRVLVPVQTMPDGSTRAWAVVGVRALRAEASFYPGFEPKIESSSGCVVRSFIPAQRTLLIGKQVEVTLRPGTLPPNRAEFRALCDREQTPERIARALEAL